MTAMVASINRTASDRALKLSNLPAGYEVVPTEAADALVAYRQRGGVVILITNAPRPSAPIRAQADSVKLPRTPPSESR